MERINTIVAEGQKPGGLEAAVKQLKKLYNKCLRNEHSGENPDTNDFMKALRGVIDVMLTEDGNHSCIKLIASFLVTEGIPSEDRNAVLARAVEWACSHSDQTNKVVRPRALILISNILCDENQQRRIELEYVPSLLFAYPQHNH